MSEGEVCGVCLTGGGNRLTYSGHSYHPPCANLWLNCVDLLLPSLTPVTLLWPTPTTTATTTIRNLAGLSGWAAVVVVVVVVEYESHFFILSLGGVGNLCSNEENENQDEEVDEGVMRKNVRWMRMDEGV